MNPILDRLEEIEARAKTETGDLGFANRLQDAQFVGWYKQDIPHLTSTIRDLVAENERLQGVVDRAVEDFDALLKFARDCAGCELCRYRPYAGHNLHPCIACTEENDLFVYERARLEDG